MSPTGAAFLAVFFAGCVLSIARHPIFGLMTYVGVFYLHPPSRWWGATLPDLRWSLFAAGITIIGLLVRKKQMIAAPIGRKGFFIGLMCFVAWLAVQKLWTISPVMHQELFVMYAKYTLLLVLIYKCVETTTHLKLFLWTHVLGCAYLGVIARAAYSGGRFEGFGGPGIGEANAGALQVLTGMLVAASLFLAARFRERVALVGVMPFLVNAMVTTISRSAFLALVVGGTAFNFMSPPKVRRLVRVLSVLGIVLLLAMTTETYWNRIQSIEKMGEDVEGVDTGYGRLVLLKAQWQMFLDHPAGCGHRCTATLSSYYLADEFLTGTGERRARSSHNTFMSLLVEQGLPGAIFYFAYLFWLYRSIIRLRRTLISRQDFLATLLPAVTAVLCAVTLGDMFVDYAKSEVRIWFVALLMVMQRMVSEPDPAPKGVA